MTTNYLLSIVLHIQHTRASAVLVFKFNHALHCDLRLITMSNQTAMGFKLNPKGTVRVQTNLEVAKANHCDSIAI